MKKIVFLILLSFTTLAFSAEESVVFETNKGNIVFKLFPKIAPKTVENFIGLTKKKDTMMVLFFTESSKTL